MRKGKVCVAAFLTESSLRLVDSILPEPSQP